MQNFGDVLKEARTKKKLTLREVGEHIGKPIGYIADIEHNRVKVSDWSTVRKLENFLSIDYESLVILWMGQN
jgi:transcriptional regulator with XRE-family HTH domain